MDPSFHSTHQGQDALAVPPGPTPGGPTVHWSQQLWLALAYLGCAQLSLLLAAPPTYAAPVWPAAGVALFGLLVWGGRCWPAVWLGVFASSLLNRAMLHGSDVTPALVALSATLAAGAALQAIIGARLLRPVLNATEPLEEERDVFFFLSLGGPLACVVSATIGVAALSVFQSLPTEALLSTWITWWAGDSLGVLLVLPVLLPLLPAIRQQWRGRALQIAVPPLVTCALALIGYVWLERAEHAAWEKQVTAASEDIQERLAIRMTRQTQRLMAVRDLFAAGIEVSDAEFKRFSLRTLTLDGLHALVWVPRVPQVERAAVEAVMRAQGRPDFMIREFDQAGKMQVAAEREEY
ncbi:MAG: MASE1 domain-containing protein, partial [Pseudogulbenkiania sp.]|nr:MASE1 domain-containing protein [Pseudogulbenkiania sp.]